MPTPPQIILRIPGLWAARINILLDISRSKTGYLFADDFLLNTRTSQRFSVLVEEHNPNIEAAFRELSSNNIDNPTLAAIGKNTHCLYFTTPAFAPDDARAAMRACDALLTAGGIAVLVESSGKVHTSQAWHELQSRADSTGLYDAFVTQMLDGPNRTYYTLGMHNLGKRDAILTGDLLATKAPTLIRDFMLHTISTEDDPTSGRTFPAKDDVPAFKISHEACTTFPPGNVYHNPYGMWRIEILSV